MTVRVLLLRCSCVTLSGIIAGCASSAPTPQPSANGNLQKAPRTAPSVSEMESPLARNGSSAFPRLDGPAAGAPRERAEAPPASPGSRPGVEETMRMDTAELHGYQFPSIEDVPAAPVESASVPVSDGVSSRLEQVEQRLRSVEAQGETPPAIPEELQRRVQELEAQLAAFENRPAQPVTGAPDELLAKFNELSEKVQTLETNQAQVPTLQEVLTQRIQEMEQRVAAAEGREPQVVEAGPPEALEQRFNELSTQLAALEARQAEIPTMTGVLNERIQEMEQKLATLEGREPQVVEAGTPAEIETRFTELSDKLAAIETQQGQAPTIPGVLQESIQQMENRLATLENRPALVVQTPPENLESRFNELTARLAAVESRSSPAVETVPEVVEARMRQMEEKLAAVEGREPRIIEADPARLEEQFNALSQRLAAVEAASAPAVVQTIPQAIEQRIQQMEEKLAASEGRAPEVIQTTPQNLEEKFAEMSQALARIENRPPTVVETIPEVLEQRIQEMERQLASEEGREPRPIEVTAESMESKFKEMSMRLGALEARPAVAPPAETVPDVLVARIQEMEQKLASIEGRPAQIVSTTPDNVTAKFNEMSTRLAELETKTSAPTATDVLGERMQEMETQIALIQNREPREVQPAAGNVEQRFDQLRTQLASLQQQVASSQANIDRLATVATSASAVTPSTSGTGATPATSIHFADASDEYRIGAGDILQFTSFNEPALTQEATVRFDGYISLPLINEVKVGDRTRTEAESLLQGQYAQVFRRPALSLTVRQALSRNFTITGDINQPGSYAYTEPISLIEAISQAGGLRDLNSGGGTGGVVGITGQLTKAFIIRHDAAGTRNVLTYDLRGLGKPGPHDSEAIVRPGDTIYVPEGVNLVYVLGESRNSVIVSLTEGMTLLQLIALSGGYDASTARLSSVVLMRQISEGETDIMLVNVKELLHGRGRDLPLQPGDVIYIPRKRLATLQDFVERFTGSISPVLDLYTSALQAYYAQDILDQSLDEDENEALRVLGQLGDAAGSYNDIDTVFGNDDAAR